MQRFLVDFESASINAIRNVLPQTEKICGCFFRLSSKLWKPIQHVGMQKHYIADLAFLPPQDVVN